MPAIVSEALFEIVQEQLAENRKLARQRRDNAPLRLLQGPPLEAASMCQSGSVEATTWPRGAPIMKITTVGIDLAKNIFVLPASRVSFCLTGAGMT
ncbi:hypothetical protein [Paraburkholderia heleia]|uniref:hypothetical protein n=1 Tax=Paraburkholderia heleia TaxID=634127 RepID=UPI002AB7C179|nr:hypothetical protein [Paraburkholderia heleia]